MFCYFFLSWSLFSVREGERERKRRREQRANKSLLFSCLLDSKRKQREMNKECTTDSFFNLA